MRLKRNTRDPLQQVTFKDQGRTHDRLLIWSGSKLLNLHKNEALEMTPKTIQGMDYLFIEKGGFHPRQGPDWKPPLYVLKRTYEEVGE